MLAAGVLLVGVLSTGTLSASIVSAGDAQRILDQLHEHRTDFTRAHDGHEQPGKSNCS